MENISSIIHRILKKSGNENIYFEGILKNNWQSFVGELFTKYSYPDRIYNKTLFICCNNPTWKQELFFFKHKIVKKVNEHFKKELIFDVKIFMKNKNY